MYYERPRGVADNIKYKFDELFRLTFRTAKTFMVQWLWIKLNCLWFFIILFQTEKKNEYIYFFYFSYFLVYIFLQKKNYCLQSVILYWISVLQVHLSTLIFDEKCKLFFFSFVSTFRCSTKKYINQKKTSQKTYRYELNGKIKYLHVGSIIQQK